MISNESAKFLLLVFDYSPLWLVLGFVSVMSTLILGAWNGWPVSGYVSKAA